jgi:hypothetical protein
MLVREEAWGCHVIGERDGGEGVLVPHAQKSAELSQLE